jgi:hypothetical protein
MGGVDLTDHYTASYSFMRRTEVVQKMFWLLEVSIVNSYSNSTRLFDDGSIQDSF